MGSILINKTSSFFKVVDSDVYRHLLHLPLLTYSLFSGKKNPVKRARIDGHRPLILIHGFGGTRGDLLPLELYFRAHGRRRIYRIDLRDKTSMEEMSKRLASYTQRVLKVNRAEQVDLVGYSLGGIISRMAIAEHGLKGLVHTLVTMGTPHQGTTQARYVGSMLGRSLRPDSETMQRVKQYPWPEGVRGISFWSKNDLIVAPPEGAAAEGTKQIDMSPFTHFSYLIDPRSWVAVKKALAD